MVAFGDGGGRLLHSFPTRRSSDLEAVDVVGQVLPGTADTFDVGLTAELSFRADFFGDAGDFGGERVELIDHGVEGVIEHVYFAVGVDGDLLGTVAFGDGGGDLGDV